MAFKQETDRRAKAQAALDAYEASGRNQNAAAAALGVSRGGLQAQLMHAAALKLKPGGTVAPHEVTLPPTERLRMTDEIKALRKELKDVVRHNLDAETVREKLFELAGQTPNPPNWLTAEPRKGSGVTGVPCTIWSDWHLGETVERGEINGVNEFSLRIAERRIQTLADRIVDLCFGHMTNPVYPGIVVNLIGDIVSGNIHDELVETNEIELFPVVLWAVERIAAALRVLLTKFDNIFVACAGGNHGRTTKKKHMKRYVFKNADWLIYCLLEREFRNDHRVQFMIPESNECLYRVYNHRYMALHGDDLGVKGGDGIIGAIGPIMRGEIKTRHSSAQIGRDYDTMLMGHWHQMLWLPRAIVNNTLKGFDEFARIALRAVASPASQALWFTHPKHGITARWEMLLEPPLQKNAAPWVSWNASKEAAR